MNEFSTRLGHCRVIVVEIGTEHFEPSAQIKHHVVPDIGRSAFDNGDSDVTVFGKTVGKHGTSGTSSNDDIVELGVAAGKKVRCERGESLTRRWAFRGRSGRVGVGRVILNRLSVDRVGIRPCWVRLRCHFEQKKGEES